LHNSISEQGGGRKDSPDLGTRQADSLGLTGSRRMTCEGRVKKSETLAEGIGMAEA